MQFTQRQIKRLLALRRTYITQLVLMSKRRQQLLHQLQAQSLPQDISRDYLSSRHVTIDSIPRQLEECENMEHVLYIQYVIAVAHGVSCCSLQYAVAEMNCIILAILVAICYRCMFYDNPLASATTAATWELLQVCMP